MIDKDDTRSRLLHDAAESLRRLDVELNAFPIWIESHTAPESRKGRRPVVLYRKYRGDGAWRMPRRDVERQSGVAEHELLAVGGLHVALGLRADGSLIEHIPVRRRHDHS